MQKKVDINGVEYTLQKIPFSSYLQLIDDTTTAKGTTNRLKYAEYMFEHVVVEPQVTVSDFDDDFTSALQLVSACDNFLTERALTKPSASKK